MAGGVLFRSPVVAKRHTCYLLRSNLIRLATIASEYAIAYDVIMEMAMLNSTLAAREIGCSVATVTRWAERLGVGVKIGSSIILDDSEVEKIRNSWKGQKGNPNFGSKKPGPK